MGDSRAVLEFVGNHGCGREARPGEKVDRCGSPGCTDCIIVECVRKLKEAGATFDVAYYPGVDKGQPAAYIEHWPIRNMNGTRRRDNANVGPVDDLVAGTRRGSFQVAGSHGGLTEDGELHYRGPPVPEVKS